MRLLCLNLRGWVGGLEGALGTKRLCMREEGERRRSGLQRSANGTFGMAESSRRNGDDEAEEEVV